MKTLINYSLAAGIIPYVKLNNTVFYLLGKEISTDIWCGFVGNYKDMDISITNTAIREFNEETCFLYNDYIPTISKLVNKTIPIIVKKSKKNIYIYFVEFPARFFNNSTTYNFNKIRYHLKINNKNNENNEYIEKYKLAWFSVNSLISNHDILPSLKKIIINNN